MSTCAGKSCKYCVSLCQPEKAKLRDIVPPELVMGVNVSAVVLFGPCSVCVFGFSLNIQTTPKIMESHAYPLEPGC